MVAACTIPTQAQTKLTRHRHGKMSKKSHPPQKFTNMPGEKVQNIQKAHKWLTNSDIWTGIILT